MSAAIAILPAPPTEPVVVEPQPEPSPCRFEMVEVPTFAEASAPGPWCPMHGTADHDACEEYFAEMRRCEDENDAMRECSGPAFDIHDLPF